MTPLHIAAGMLALGLLFYLFAALIYPELFT